MCDLKQGLKGKQDRYFCFSDFCCFRVAGDLLELSPAVLCGLAKKYTPAQNVAMTVTQARREVDCVSDVQTH